MKKVVLATCALLLLSTVSPAQTRSRRTTKHPSTTKSSNTATAQAVAKVRTEGATRVANQIKNLSTFLYLVGGVAHGIEAIDASNTGALEVYFRSTPELQPYYAKLVGSASGAADAETQAKAGQFNQAGRTLLGVVGRLTDVLVLMR